MLTEKKSGKMSDVVGKLKKFGLMAAVVMGTVLVTPDRSANDFGVFTKVDKNGNMTTIVDTYQDGFKGKQVIVVDKNGNEIQNMFLVEEGRKSKVKEEVTVEYSNESDMSYDF